MKASIESKIAVLGGGPAGLSACFHLSKWGFKGTLIEKEPMIGGLCKTVNFNGIHSDFGPHRFYSKDPMFYELMENLLGEDWLLLDRFTRFYIGGKFFKYPVEMGNALKNMGIGRSFKAVLDYLMARAKKKITNPPVNNFKDHILLEFGYTLANLNILNYTEKIWGLPVERISPDWAKQRIKGLSLASIVKKALWGGGNGCGSLVDRFHYPRKGAMEPYAKMASYAEKHGFKIETSSPVVSIKHSDNTIKKVTFKKGGEIREIDVDFVISSIPITYLIEILNPSPPDEVVKASKKLKWRNQVYLFIGVNKERVTKDNWIYFPEKEIRFGRIYEAKNFSKDMAKEGQTGLWVEYFVFPKDEIWNMKEDELFEITIKGLEKINLLKRNDVLWYKKYQSSFTYPIYDLEYKTHLKVIKEYLNHFTNLQLIGRAGRFRYNNQDHSIKTGFLAAKGLKEGEKYNLDKVGSENEYLEKGILSNVEKHTQN